MFNDRRAGVISTRYAPSENRPDGRTGEGRAVTQSIVLIHAIRSSRTMWKGQVRRLRERGYQVIAPDLPGHGRRRGEPFTLEGARATLDHAVDAC